MEWVFWLGTLVLIGYLFARKGKSGKKTGKPEAVVKAPPPETAGGEEEQASFKMPRISVPKVPETFPDEAAAKSFIADLEGKIEQVRTAQEQLEHWYVNAMPDTEAAERRYERAEEALSEIDDGLLVCRSDAEQTPYAWRYVTVTSDLDVLETPYLLDRVVQQKEMAAFLKKNPDLDKEDFEEVTLESPDPPERPEDFDVFLGWCEQIKNTATVEEYVTLTEEALERGPVAMREVLGETPDIPGLARDFFRERLGVNKVAFEALESRGVFLPEHLDRVDFKELATVKGIGPKTIRDLEALLGRQ